MDSGISGNTYQDVRDLGAGPRSLGGTWEIGMRVNTWARCNAGIRKQLAIRDVCGMFLECRQFALHQVYIHRHIYICVYVYLCIYVAFLLAWICSVPCMNWMLAVCCIRVSRLT